MKTLRIIDRIFSNLGIAKENSNDIRTVKDDIQDTLATIFGTSESPRKLYEVNTTETEDTVENFTDETYISGLSFTVFTQSSPLGNLVLLPVSVPVEGGGTEIVSSTGIILVEDLSQINQVSFNLTGDISDTPTPVIVQILAEDNTELFSDTLDYDGSALLHTVLTGCSGVNIKLKITVTVPATWISITVDNLIINKDKDNIILPDDCLIPYEARFDCGSAQLVSKEMTAEDYMLWNPNKPFTSLSEVSPGVNETFALQANTDQNLLYDRKLGYYFNFVEDKVILYYKPGFTGTIRVWHSYIPDVVVNEEDTIKVNRTFIDMIVSGGTARGLLRKITTATTLKTKLTEVELSALRIGFLEHKDNFKKLLRDFISMTSSKAEPELIRPNDFLNDTTMLLN